MLRGVNERTFQKLQLGEGAFLNTEYTKGTQLTPDMIISATRGGATISITPVWRTRVIDGIHSNTAEARVVDNVTATASFTALEVTGENFAKAIGCATYDTETNKVNVSHTVTMDNFEPIYWVGTLSDGVTEVQITFANALNTNGLQLRATEKNEGELALNFEANYSVNSLDTPPVEIEFLS